MFIVNEQHSKFRKSRKAVLFFPSKICSTESKVVSNNLYWGKWYTSSQYIILCVKKVLGKEVTL